METPKEERRTPENDRRANGRDRRTQPPNRDNSRPSPAAIAIASICFGVCILAVLFGIAVILYGKRMFGV